MFADIRDSSQLARLSDWVSAWDETLSVYSPPADAILYEPDATLYGFALSGPMTNRLYHRERVLRLGDAIVVPQGLAMEIEPAADLLAIGCAGQAPDHFRERFIQVWGYDHFRADDEIVGQSAELASILPAADLRYRLSYSLAVLGRGSGSVAIPSDELDLTLCVALNGAVAVTVEQGSGSSELRPGQALGYGPNIEARVEGAGRFGVIRLVSDPAFHARRAMQRSDSSARLSPEAGSRRYNRGDHETSSTKAHSTDDLSK